MEDGRGRIDTVSVCTAASIVSHLLPDVEPHHAGLRARLQNGAKNGQRGGANEGPLAPELVAEDAEEDLAGQGPDDGGERHLVCVCVRVVGVWRC